MAEDRVPVEAHHVRAVGTYASEPEQLGELPCRDEARSGPAISTEDGARGNHRAPLERYYEHARSEQLVEGMRAFPSLGAPAAK